ncbi:MAG: substrate-binding domain-containing protein [Aigarchaeota archaeon]|nr:substrate-binding domain-containing protein [Candidatus Calditenuis fumarioli]
MRRIFLIGLVLAVGAAALLAYQYVMTARAENVTVYAAPTLAVLANDAKARMQSPYNVTVIVMGSAAAVRRIEQGAVPDALLSVDAELVNYVKQYRSVTSLGNFKLNLICREKTTLEDLSRKRIGLANPNTAPIGYRAIAALYWMAVKRNIFKVEDLERYLSVKFEAAQDRVIIEMREFKASGPFLARDDLSASFQLLENGAVDCIFAYVPFAVSRNLEGKYAVISLPEEISFGSDPPMRFIARITLGELEVKRFEAVAIAFTDKGERFVREVVELLRLNPARYGLRV